MRGRVRGGYLLIACLLSFSLHAQNDGGISPAMLQQIQASQPTASSANRAISNALTFNAIDDLARNAASAADLDTHFSIETPSQSITDQKSSGRCWMFSGMNVLRADFALAHKDTLTIEFSQDYLFIYDQLEKSNLFLQGVIDCAKQPMDDTRVQFFFKAPINDGGTFCGVADLAEKYGLVPKAVMPETFTADNTSRFSRLLSSRLREMGLQLRQMVADGKKAKAINEAKTKMLAEVWQMLTLAYGTPPTEFTYAFKDKHGKQQTEAKTYTPQSFYKEVVGGDLNGTFLMVMNDPRRPYYETFEVEWDRHTYDGHNWRYVNLPMDDIEQMAIAAMRDGHKLYSSYDVGKQLDRKRGYCDTENYDYESLFGTTFGMDKAQRIATFDSGSTHAMTLCAVDLDVNGKATKWKVENSWGGSWGQAGCLIMTDRWFREYSFRLVINKRYATERVLQAAQKKPTMVMPEDPLFQYDD